MEKKLEMKEIAISRAVAIHCSPVANKNKTPKPADVLETAKKIYDWLKA